MTNSRSRLKVCHVMASNSPGGLEKHFVEISHEMAALCSVYAIGDGCYRNRFSNDVAFFPIDVSASKWNPMVYWRLLKTLQMIQPDIVHAHGNRAAELVAAIRPLIGAKCIGTVHWHLRKRRNRRAYEKLDGVIGVSTAVLRNIHNPVRKVVYNGVSICVDALDRNQLAQRFDIDPQKAIAVAVGRMTRGKGFDVLIRAWRDIEAELLLVGDGRFWMNCAHWQEMKESKSTSISPASWMAQSSYFPRLI